MKRYLVKAHLDRLATAHGGDLESVCEQCGRCCFEKIRCGSVMYFGQAWCPHLLPSNACDCYASRSKVPWCLPLSEALVRQVLPSDCPYAQGLAGYVGPE